jgi:hypothetical protein
MQRNQASPWPALRRACEKTAHPSWQLSGADGLTPRSDVSI